MVLVKIVSMLVPTTAIALVVSESSTTDFCVAIIFAGYVLLRECLHLRSLERRSRR